ncbi:hypothetical protein ACROYT_G009877 [Oculina patagonica]
MIGTTHCLLECVKNHGCFSTNVAVDHKNYRNFTCELLPTDKYNASMSFKRRNFYNHFSLVSPCEGVPCKHGGTCRANYETGEYKCDCLSVNVDKNCEPKESASTTTTTQAKSVSPSSSSQIQPTPTIETTPAAPCDPSNGWYHYSGSCYKFFASTVNRQTAKTQCESVGAHLVAVHSSAEQDFVTFTLIPSQEIIWTGLERDLNSGTFSNWDDGSPVDYTDWGQNSPTSLDSGDHCVTLRPLRADPSNYVMNDIFCTIKRAFVCEKGA